MSMNDVKSLSHSKWRCKIYNYMVDPIKPIDINSDDDREKDREYYINSQGVVILNLSLSHGYGLYTWLMFYISDIKKIVIWKNMKSYLL